MVVVTFTSLLVVYAVSSSSPSLPEVGLQVEAAWYDSSTQWFQVSGTISYEIESWEHVTICLIAIKDGERTIDVERGNYGLYYVSLYTMQKDWVINEQGIQLASTNLQLTFSYKLERQIPLTYQFIVVDSGTKQFPINIVLR
jgi:hypothetical protein